MWIVLHETLIFLYGCYYFLVFLLLSLDTHFSLIVCWIHLMLNGKTQGWAVCKYYSNCMHTFIRMYKFVCEIAWIHENRNFHFLVCSDYANIKLPFTYVMAFCWRKNTHSTIFYRTEIIQMSMRAQMECSFFGCTVGFRTVEHCNECI